MELKAGQKKAYDWKETGKAIGFYRRSLHLTMYELAKKMGAVVSTISFWERGIKEPKISHLVAVAKILGVSEMDLLHPSEEVKRWGNLSLKEP